MRSLQKPKKQKLLKNLFAYFIHLFRLNSKIILKKEQEFHQTKQALSTIML